jgi:pyridoxamine-phosphate oxidase
MEKVGLPSAASLGGDSSLYLPEFDDPPIDPVPLLSVWLELADGRAVSEPRAAVLSTVSSEGQPSSRVVLLKGLFENLLIFTTSRSSRKGRELALNPRVSLTLHWRETVQQLNLCGTVEAMSPAFSDSLFEERPVDAQAAALVSIQGNILLDEAELKVRARNLVASGRPLVRPESWVAYGIRPSSIEFWQGRSDRLHRRLRYALDERSCTWSHVRLQP